MFLLRRYKDKIKKILKRIEPTLWLFGACFAVVHGWIYYKKHALVERDILLLHKNYPKNLTVFSDETVVKLKLCLLETLIGYGKIIDW